MKKTQHFLLLFLTCCASSLFANKLYLDNNGFVKSALLNYTITDISNLLKQSKITVTDKEADANWKIVLHLEQNKMAYASLYDANNKTTQQFTIQCKQENNIQLITINSSSEKGLSNGLYYFLQNKLGFEFYHPKESIIPDLSNFVLDTFTETITPRFDKIGFHIHAMHPLEITEALLNEDAPNGAAEIKTYIDWLCRNGQNYFEFNLLRSIKLKTWIPYIKPVIDYAHERGIVCGADLSFHMIQQRAFELYKSFPSSFRKKDTQIKDNISQLMQINWDVLNVEMATTEFTHKNQDKLYQQQKFLYNLLTPYHVKLTSRMHVVKDENLLSNAKSMKKTRTDMESAYSLFVHTVMFYSLQDTSAPVYRNKDFSHLRNALIENKQYRDTWYYPESAYWITFDNSVPMFLTPYLDARLKDILYCDSLGIDGHLTFSSGWEWNHWLIDWSIARWCWKVPDEQKQAFEFLQKILKSDSIMSFIYKANALQEKFIKGKQLIRVMDAQTITDEIGGKLNLEFHPRPEYSYKYIMNDATNTELSFVQQKYVNVLDSFVQAYNNLIASCKFSTENKLVSEMLLSLDITALRAEHRKNTLSYLIAYRMNKINKTKTPIVHYLNNAKTIRENALALVKKQEGNYRYPISSVASEKKSKTVYNFGYLYPVSNLHFWQREELQAQHNKWKFWYQNIWDVLKIIGVKK